MTTVYFVRHAEPNYDNHNDMMRELSSKGLKDREGTLSRVEKKIELNLVSLFPNRQVDRVNAVEMIQDFSGKVPAYGVASFLVKIKWF